MGQIKEFCETIAGATAPNMQMNAALHTTLSGSAPAIQDAMPDINALREEAILAGAMDPMSLRFRIVEFDKTSGEQVGVPADDISFSDGILRTASLIEARYNSHFCLEPVGFLQ
jgi:hypothetical protein